MVALVLTLVVASLVTACSPSPTPAATPSSSPADDPWVAADERVFGTIVGFDLDAPSVTLDLGRWFGDPDEANVAARADGVIGPDEDLPAPFYVRDLHERRVIRIDPSAAIIVLGHDEEGNVRPTRVTMAEFMANWQLGPPSGAWIPAAYHWCWLRDGRVVGIEAEFTP